MSKPPILIMANHVDGLGGVERVAHGLSGELARRGYEVALRGIRPTAGHRMSIDPVEYSMGFMSPRSEAPPTEKPLPRATRKAMRAEAVSTLRDTLADYRDGIVVAMQVYVMEHLAEIGIESVMESGTRIIGQYHWSYQGARSTTDFDRISGTYRQIDKFLLLTEDDATAFRRDNFNNTGAMPNALSMYPSSVDGPRENVVVALARYDEVKQLDHALRAWALLADELPDWRLELYGDGPEQDSLQALVDELGIGDRAALMGVTEATEEVLLRSKLLVLSSRFEGLPMVLAEALACGVPAVAYDCAPGVREIVEDGVTGLVISQNHISGLAQGLKALMTDEELRGRMSRAARARSSLFAVDTVMDRWEDLFERVTR